MNLSDWMAMAYLHIFVNLFSAALLMITTVRPFWVFLVFGVNFLTALDWYRAPIKEDPK